MASYECRGKKQLWSVRFYVIEDGTETLKRLSGFPRKKDAEVAYHNFMNEYNDKLKKATPSAIIMDRYFNDVFEEYIDYKEDKYKDSSFYELNKNYEKHIKPYFKTYKLKHITKNIIRLWQQTKSNYSYKFKTKLRGYLHSF